MMVEIISILFIDTYLGWVLSLVFCIGLLYAFYVQYPSIKFQTTITVTVKAFTFLCLFVIVSIFWMLILLALTYIVSFSLLSFFLFLFTSESLYRFFFVIIFFILLFASLYPIYKKYREKGGREIVWLWIKRFTFLSSYILLGLLVVVIEYLFDFRPNTNEIDLLNESMDMHYSQREVYNHYQGCLIPFTCKEYFRFYATREEIDELIHKQGFKEYSSESSYFYDIMEELQSQYIRRFHPSGNNILYYYAEIESYNLFLYYDADNGMAYLITSYMH